MRNSEKFEAQSSEVPNNKESQEQAHKPTREEVRKANEPETTQLNRDFNEKFNKLFQTDDPHLARLINVTSRGEDSMIVQRFLDDNRERLSVEAQEFLEASINVKRTREAARETEIEENVLSEEEEKAEMAKWERHSSSMMALFQKKDDLHRERVLKLIDRVSVAEDSFILQGFLDDNKESLSPIAIEAIESKIQLLI